MSPQANGSLPGFREALIVWLRVAALSFGGPAGQIAVMHRIIVEEKRWLDEERFLHALNFCMLLPGPEAQQLATYIGWLLHRVKGGLAAGLLFILPGVIVMMALSWVYVLYGNVGLVAGLFFGLKAAVLALVFEAMLRIGRRALRTRWHYGIAAAAFVAIALLNAPFPLIVAAAALTGWLLLSRHSREGGNPASSSQPVNRTLSSRVRGHVAFILPLVFAVLWALPLILLPPGVFHDLAFFFSRLAVVTFGGAYAVLAYMGQAAVSHFHWLTPAEMLDGLGLAETTPGPLIMVTQFVGFLAAYRNPGPLDPLLAGTLGGLLTTWVTFVPCFLWIFAGAPHVERLRQNRALSAALAGITAAVVGVILNLGLWFAIHFVRPDAGIDWRAAILSATALVAALRFKVGMIPLIAGSMAAGLALQAI